MPLKGEHKLQPSVLAGIEKLYSDNLRRYGISSKSVGWKDEVSQQLPVFSANNPPLHDHETGQKSLPGAGLRADVGG